jgi:ABC-type dipeptide/oligopeptide/nickel transport system permease subunit
MARKKITAPNTEQLALSELTIEQRQIEGLSLSTVVRRRFFQHKAAVTSMIVLGLIVLLAFTSVGTIIGGTGRLAADTASGEIILDGLRINGWWPFDWYRNYPITTPGGLPSWEHPFGQDTLGKDIFARVMRGIQQSLTVVTLIGAIATVLGVVIGAIAGFMRGWLDNLLMRLTDAIIIIPGLILGAVLGRTIGGNAISLGILLGLVSWTGLARLVRGEFLALREREFVDAARVAGASNFRIIFRHILPNSIGIVVVNATLLMSAAILTETALSFLGFGITAPDISLGQIISQYNEAFKTRPWLFWWPGFFIVVVALCINFIGDGLRDAFDPRQRRMPKMTSLSRQFRELIGRGNK